MTKPTLPTTPATPPRRARVSRTTSHGTPKNEKTSVTTTVTATGATVEEAVETAAKVAASISPSKRKKLAQIASFHETPFPGFERPTPEECKNVHDLLSTVHGTPVRPIELVDRADGPAGCGEVPNVLDALVRTILSQSTTSANATAAKRALDVKYGRANYRAVLNGTLPELQKTIMCGGLGNIKGRAIMNTLKAVDEKEGGKGDLSLDYLHDFSDVEALKELASFEGIGIKTASCVLLFCLKRNSFAVDTHVFRIVKSLGWVPSHATRDSAFQHLDLAIPADLKYGLHSLFVKHGRGCEKCSAGHTTMNHVDSCPIDDIVVREKVKGKGKVKAGGKAVKKRKTGKAAGKSLSDDDEDVEVKAVDGFAEEIAGMGGVGLGVVEKKPVVVEGKPGVKVEHGGRTTRSQAKRAFEVSIPQTNYLGSFSPTKKVKVEVEVKSEPEMMHGLPV